MSDSAFWENRYAGSDYIFGTAPNAFLASHRDLLKAGATALAVADGEGRNGVFLAECGLDVLSMDFSPAALAKGQKLANSRGVSMRTERIDILAWSWPQAAFDVVAAIFIQFAAPAARDAIFAGIGRALKPGGLLLMEGHRPEQLAYNTGGTRNVENLYTRQLLERWFGDWEVLELREHDSVIQEGTGHAGVSALIDLVARSPARP